MEDGELSPLKVLFLNKLIYIVMEFASHKRKLLNYRCVLCGTVAKSRNSLHSHMSRQHRGISTKDLPVLQMPTKFNPELASQ